MYELSILMFRLCNLILIIVKYYSTSCAHYYLVLLFLNLNYQFILGYPFILIQYYFQQLILVFIPD